jgi:elongation factor G
MLDAVIDYLPSRSTSARRSATRSRTRPSRRPARRSSTRRFSALAFKIAVDPHVGKLTYIRVYSGTLTAGTQVLNATKDRKEKIGRLMQMHANSREDISEVKAGDICAVIGLKQTTTGDTLAGAEAPIVLESMSFPDPVISVAIEPKTKGDQEKLGTAIQRLAEEDPTFKVYTDEETGQTIIAGMGELHLDILVDRMRREFKVEANVGKPQVAYRETLRGRSSAWTSPTRSRPAAPASSPRSSCASSRSPSRTRPADPDLPVRQLDHRWARPQGVHPGRRPGLPGGHAARHPRRLPAGRREGDLTDGAYHDVDSSEMAFKIAGSMGFKEAARKADPALMEPMMAVEVTTPEENMGDVIGDLNSRRGMIQAMDERAGVRVVKALVPLSEMFGYVGDLRSKTQGRASYSMQFDSYAEVPWQRGEGDHREGPGRVVPRHLAVPPAFDADVVRQPPH